MGLFDGGSSSSNSYSGLRAPGWENFHSFKNILDRTPNDVGFLVDRLKRDVNQPLPQFNLNSQGFLPEQMEGVNVFGRNMFANVASNYASRGHLNPEALGGVIGSAVREATPNMMSMIGQNVRDSMLIPETIKQGRFGALQNALNLYPSLLGSEGHSSQQGPSMLGQNLAQWANPNSYANLITAVGSVGSGGGGTPKMY